MIWLTNKKSKTPMDSKTIPEHKDCYNYAIVFIICGIVAQVQILKGRPITGCVF